MMIDDFLAPSQSAKKIEKRALDWRHALGVPNQWAPDILELIEAKLPKLFRTFALVVRPDIEMADAEAYTEFDPPLIAVRNSVYSLARRREGRARMTFAHELGHLVMHPGAAKLRIESGNKTPVKIRPFESAEWQARKFAAYFLLPTHIVVQFGTIRKLAENCHVSLQAAEIRFNEVGHIRQTAVPCLDELIQTIITS
jgi:Zn-dependent peptidase ImmA (M78 family)